jgi:excisionase family DNA binding protein
MGKTIEQRIEGLEQGIQYITGLLEQMDANFKMVLHNHAEERILSAKEVADMLNMDINLLYTKCRNNEMPNFKMGKSLRFKKTEVLEWVKKQRKGDTGSIDDMVSQYLQKNPLRR